MVFALKPVIALSKTSTQSKHSQCGTKSDVEHSSCTFNLTCQLWNSPMFSIGLEDYYSFPNILLTLLNYWPPANKAHLTHTKKRCSGAWISLIKNLRWMQWQVSLGLGWLMCDKYSKKLMKAFFLKSSQQAIPNRMLHKGQRMQGKSTATGYNDLCIIFTTRLCNQCGFRAE